MQGEQHSLHWAISTDKTLTTSHKMETQELALSVNLGSLEHPLPFLSSFSRDVRGTFFLLEVFINKR